MDQVVGELAKLIEHDVVGVGFELRALVVDLFDVALGADGAHDIRRIADPSLEPSKTLIAHTFGKNGNPTATEYA
jgi:hypothetical protein